MTQGIHDIPAPSHLPTAHSVPLAGQRPDAVLTNDGKVISITASAQNLREAARRRSKRREAVLELPDATRELGSPVTVRVRALTMKEMVALGTIPNPLAEMIEAFQSEITVYSIEAAGDAFGETMSEDESKSTNRLMLRNLMRDQGMMWFTQHTDAARDATVVCCVIEPPVVFEEYELAEHPEGVLLRDISEEDRAFVQKEVQRLTGETSADEIKSVRDEADQDESAEVERADADVALPGRDEPLDPAEQRDGGLEPVYGVPA